MFKNLKTHSFKIVIKKQKKINRPVLGKIYTYKMLTQISVKHFEYFLFQIHSWKRRTKTKLIHLKSMYWSLK